MDLKKYIDEVQDFPKKGIGFKDMSPILENIEALKYTIELFKKNIGTPDKIVGLDARGFIFGGILAYEMNIPFIMLRKAGKLPGDCESISYDLEYGSNTFEIQKNAIKSGDKIALVDDLLATGGSILAAIKLVEKLGGEIESINNVIELEFLNPRNNLNNYKINSLVKY